MKHIAPQTHIGHVHMKSANLSLPKQFYVDILGFHITIELPGALFLAAGDYHHHLAFNTWESKDGMAPPNGTTGLYHIAIVYPTRKDLADALQGLIDARYPLDGAADHGTHEALYLSDLEGNGIELYWDRPQDEWPKDAQGKLNMVTKSLDLEDLLTELSRS